MSSVRRLKQKGIATTGTGRWINPAEALTVGMSTAYDYRKAAFASLPPATMVRPMRVVRAKLAAAQETADRAIQAGVKAGFNWAQINEATVYVQAELQQALRRLKLARSAADAGSGRVVHALAR